MRRHFTVLAATIVLSLAGARALAVDLGDEAPTMDVTEWVNGPAVDLAAGRDKSVHLVAFLTTYDKDCQEAFKQLGKLLEKYKSQGLVVVGVCDQMPDKVKEWLATNAVAFSVAADPRKNTVAPYMKGMPGVPYTFIVGKDGTVSWHGSPTVGMEDVLEKVMTGKYDAAHEKAVSDARKALHKEWQKGVRKTMEGPLDALLKIEPGDTEALSLKLRFLQSPEERGQKIEPGPFHTFCDAHAKRIQDKPDALNMLAWELATHGNFAWRRPELAFELAKQAVKVSEGKKADIVDTLARVYFEVGNVKKAVEVQKQAVGVADADKKDDLGKTLAYDETCLKLAEKAK